MPSVFTLRTTPEHYARVQAAANSAALSMNAYLLGLTAGLPGVCRVCGCTQDSGCAEGCSWVDATCTLCSACNEHLEGRDQWDALGLVLREAPQ
jgi:hypothetical protein